MNALWLVMKYPDICTYSTSNDIDHIHYRAPAFSKIYWSLEIIIKNLNIKMIIHTLLKKIIFLHNFLKIILSMAWIIFIIIIIICYRTTNNDWSYYFIWKFYCIIVAIIKYKKAFIVTCIIETRRTNYSFKQKKKVAWMWL